MRPTSADVELADASVGYYVHHQGSGHRHRASSVAARLVERGLAVTGLSSGPRPPHWPGEWVELTRDDAPAVGAGGGSGAAYDVTAHGRLHWVPLHHEGLRARTAAISAWIERTRPAALVSDVSQEVTLLARLHGVAVVSVVLPGDRTDPAHALGLGVSAALVGCWPPSATVGMTPGLDPAERGRLHAVGGLARFEPRSAATPGTRRVVVLGGTGDAGPDARERAALIAAREQTPDWTWSVLGQDAWTDDPWSVLTAAEVVVTHGGQNALAEVAAARVPAVVVPRARPHDEQVTTGGVLAADPWPALVLDELPFDGWPALLASAAALDGGAWTGWVDGGAAGRFADVVAGVVRGSMESSVPIALDVSHRDTPGERAERPGLSARGSGGGTGVSRIVPDDMALDRADPGPFRQGLSRTRDDLGARSAP